MSHGYACLIAVAAALAACGEGLTGPPTGAVEITSVTQGEPADPDGYTVALDGREHPLGANGKLTLAGVTLGDHRLQLLGIAPNCVLGGENPRTVTVPDGILRVTLEIACFDGHGSISVFTSTSGPNPDLDGYALRLDDGAAQPIGMNGLVTYPALPAGSHTLQLSAIAANCLVTEPNPRTLAVAAGADSIVRFAVKCRSTAPGSILLTSDRGGAYHVFRVEPDGSGLRDLTPDANGTDADWSPDHGRIVFASTRDGGPAVYLMSADGSSPLRLAPGSSPAWSPDGSRIAFAGSDGLTVMNADGSDPMVLGPGQAPAWSPDGTRIAFTRTGRCVADICGVDLYLMAADGSSVRKLSPGTTLSDAWLAPSWSPDGTRIAFTRVCCFLSANRNGVWVVDPAGGAPSLVHSGRAAGKPVWSPDGSTLAFAVRQDDWTTELMLMPAAGGAPEALAGSTGSEFPSSWR